MMYFNSIEYLIFLPLVFIAHYFSQNRFRWVVLSLASLMFYAALKIPYLLFILFAVTSVSYLVGILIGKCESERQKSVIFWCGIALNLLVLVGCKYLPFLAANINNFLNALHLPFYVTEPHVLVSVGVSFYLFQIISYLADIYLGIEKPEHHFGYFVLYMAFFPKLLQGPIERAGDLLPQLRTPYEFNYDNMRSGMLLFSWGLFKKIVIADRLAQLVNPVYNDVHSYSGLFLLMATYYYALQIYFDFSGYTDMAIGGARLFNINLTANFNSPYFATSIADFWRRWHISFSRWILDYIFKPLQMAFRNHKESGTAFALMLTFLACGIWHGASWTFIVWGLLHGTYLTAALFYRPWKKKFHSALRLDNNRLWQMFFTFNLVCFAWIFFRANSINDAVYVSSTILRATAAVCRHPLSAYVIPHSFVEISNLVTLNQGFFKFVFIIGPLGIAWAVHGLNVRIFSARSFFSIPFWLRWPIYYGLVLYIIFGGVSSSDKPFIYFQF